ncbi:M20 family metallopeptidase [Pseudonocardia sichuanensis]|uniref:Acetylornithine deacetylase/succinyl-diaminopimelate desuccinylase-like protein n=1 Tax=Pseudonocardia kunmingensis TaxID=630975 RepID=A0A543DI89_9PSEU|nr:peptidase dimerization domain-containing protein [Pseudonocardia kunmingensis]TQM09056.1 acetylornithine deacetylase/succinyl-diaminopimelate desuccinylase-like protein [Pseudonocardia kunmingensis]
MSDLLLESAVDLARIPSAVPPGANTLIEPDDPLLVDYVQKHLRPRFVGVGCRDVLDLPRNQFAVRFGTGAGPCLALVAYTPTQHHNLMADPWSGRIATPPGIDEPCLFGQGITQNKVHQACLLSTAAWLSRSDPELDGTLLLCINNEGRSSHDCSNALLDALPVRPDLMIQLFPTAFAISTGNRGRIDLHVDVSGRASHSSTPPPGGGVIATARQVLNRIDALDADVRRRVHPRLGHEHAVPYQVVFEPLAPHTLPASARITVDRRLLPGTDPDGTADELRRALEGLDDHCEVTVRPGVRMLPAEFPADRAALLEPLERAVGAYRGSPAAHTTYGGTFDAGGPSARGVPTVMFGVPEEGDLLGDDFVRVSDLRLQDRIVQDMVATFFGIERAEVPSTRRLRP